MIIGRSKYQQEIDAQVDQLDEEFQQAEGYGEIPEVDGEWDHYSEGMGDVLPGSDKMDHPHPKMSEQYENGKNGTTQKEEKSKIKSLRS